MDILGLIRFRETEKGSILPALYVSTARFDIAEVLAEMTGMKVTTVARKYSRVGCGEHCTDAHLHVDSTTARWNLTGGRCTVFLNAVRPFLKTNLEEADRALKAGLEAAYKPATLTKMYELGWPKLEEPQA